MSPSYKLFTETLSTERARLKLVEKLAMREDVSRIVARLEQECVVSLAPSGLVSEYWEDLSVRAEITITAWRDLEPLLTALEDLGLEFKSSDDASEGIIRRYSAELHPFEEKKPYIGIAIKATIPEGEAKECRRVLVRHEYDRSPRSWPVYELVCDKE